jgi:tetratricopeptide (TPR) repeat protein
MSVSRIIALTALGAALAVPLSAQGIPRGAHVGGAAATNRTPILVSNPYVFAQADSAPAVHVGDAMRKRMEKTSGADYSVVPDSIMNAALLQFGYPKDAILSPVLARTLAKNLPGTRVVITSTLSKAPDGSRTIVARLSGTNDDAGNVVRVAQGGAEPVENLGVKAADALQPALRSLADARTCMDQRVTNKGKATEAANKALKTLPTNGLAHYCLALIADSNHAQPEKVQQLEATVAGDSLSVVALKQLAQSYQQRGDTAKAVATLQQILRAAPTDQDLRQSAFRYFLSSGNTDAAIQVADEGLKLDPYNWDLYDLKSNACLFAANYKCAVDVLAKAYETDSSRADTLFFAKIGAAAEQRLSDTLPKASAADTATYVLWAVKAAGRYPTNLTLLQNLDKAYTYSGQVDSSVAVTKRLLAIDSSNVTPALAAAQALITAKRTPEALPFIDLALRRAASTADSATIRENAARLLTGAALPLLQAQPGDFKGAADILRVAVKSAPSASIMPTANYLFGLATFYQVPAIDKQAVATKSCDLAKQEDALLTEAEAAFNIGKTAKPEDSAAKLAIIAQYKPHSASLLKAYCK